MNHKDPHLEIDDLLSALYEDRITAEELQQLEVFLASDPNAVSYYADFMQVCCDLRRYHGAAVTQMPAEARPDDPRATVQRSTYQAPARAIRRWFPTYVWSLAAVLALVIGLIGFLARSQPRDVRPELTTRSSVAVLTRVAQATWEDTGMPTDVGSALAPGKLKLTRGSAQIEFYSGAIVLLQGPAEFELVSAERGYCRYGKVRAHVPPQAQGFTIATTGLDVVDLGTEFGLSIGRDGRTEVHVFEGKVELKGAGPSKELTTGKGLLIGATGEVREISIDDGAFISQSQLIGITDDTLRRRWTQWHEYSQQLRADPALLLYYTFDGQEPWERILRNQAKDAAEDGAIVGAQWSQGRWLGKGALEFKRVGDRVRVHLPGQYESMTFATWVRFDSLDRRFTSLMLTDQWDPLRPHWQVSWDGEITLGIRIDTGSGIHGINYYSPKHVLGIEDIGRWVHLVTVYDGQSDRVTHYLDGRLLPTSAHPVGILDVGAHADLAPLTIGDAELGNWRPVEFSQLPNANERRLVRSLNGRMDEFIVFGRALSDEEIGQMYEAGKPND